MQSGFHGAQRCWSAAARRVQASLDDLTPVVRERCAPLPDAATIDEALADAIDEITAGLERFGEALAMLGDGDADADGGAASQDPAAGLRALLSRAGELLPPSDLIQLMDENGFIELSLETTLKAALRDLERFAQGDRAHASR
jgi:hypothetical protein